MSASVEFDADLARKQEQLAKTPEMVAQRQALHTTLDLQHGEHVLDVGSGNGIMVREMAERVRVRGTATGADTSEVMVTMARGMCSEIPNVLFEQADATSLPFSDQTFDAVTLAQCLCFVPDVDAALGEMYRVTKPGGRAVMLESDWDSLVWNCADQVLMDKMLSFITSVYSDPYLPRTLTPRLKRAGFHVSGCDSFVIVNQTQDSNNMAGQYIEGIKSLAEASDRISGEELRQWLEDLKEKDRSGEFFFSFNRYVFTATRP